MSDEKPRTAAAKQKIWAGAEKGTALYRQIDREQKRKRRADQRLAAYVPTADEWSDEFQEKFSAQYEELNSYAKQLAKTVAEDLGRGITSELETLDQVAWTLLSFRKNLIKHVNSPSGEMFGGLFFADVIGKDIIHATHEYGLERASTYSSAYRELLGFLDRRYGSNVYSSDSSERLSAIAVKQELAGNYIFVPKPKPEPRPLGRNELTQKQCDEYCALAKNKTCASLAEFKSLSQEEIDKRLAVVDGQMVKEN